MSCPQKEKCLMKFATETRTKSLQQAKEEKEGVHNLAVLS